MTGRFFTFEGIDGSGKTTVSRLVYEALRQDHDVKWTKEPTGGWTGEAVSRAVKEGLDAVTVSLLFTADRNQHVREIRRWLSDGTTVLCDRYVHSTIAYQSVHLAEHVQSPFDWIRSLHRPFYLPPCLTFLFVLDVDTALHRIRDRCHSPFERRDFLEQVQHNYVHLAREEHFEVLDATESREALAEICIKKIREEMGDQ
ncbi:MAG: dTMP kinase [Candidatus Thermoplasmatota archaeon]|nr:dTMP kinase [Candidatus Thermoplasmatota archaeon]MDD5778817.1 dTMP kinase [Candidatus Thermoplasmatota archaeon]